MSTIIPFDFESETVGVVIGERDDPWFVASDVCDALSIRNSRDAIARLEPEDKGVAIADTPGGRQSVTTINESGLYSLILTSRKPEARRFKRWVTADVLPSIRKHGGYLNGQEETDDPELIMARALQVAQGVIDEKKRELAAAENRLAEQKPKVDFYDQVTGSRQAIDIGRAAKVLNIRGMGRNKLFQFLREERILQPNNMPYQQHIDAGRFRVVESKWQTPAGETRVSMKTLVYQRGLDYIRKKIEQSREDVTL